jgi:hypothetical protein
MQMDDRSTAQCCRQFNEVIVHALGFIDDEEQFAWHFGNISHLVGPLVAEAIDRGIEPFSIEELAARDHPPSDHSQRQRILFNASSTIGLLLKIAMRAARQSNNQHH